MSLSPLIPGRKITCKCLAQAVWHPLTDHKECLSFGFSWKKIAKLQAVYSLTMLVLNRLTLQPPLIATLVSLLISYLWICVKVQGWKYIRKNVYVRTTIEKKIWRNSLCSYKKKYWIYKDIYIFVLFS